MKDASKSIAAAFLCPGVHSHAPTCLNLSEGCLVVWPH